MTDPEAKELIHTASVVLAEAVMHLEYFWPPLPTVRRGRELLDRIHEWETRQPEAEQPK